MTDQYIMVLDEGTTSTRAMLFTADGTVVAQKSHDIDQIYPRPAWVEHDPAQIWQRTLACARAIVERAGGGTRIAAIGITNQRETVVAWDKATGKPVCNAIVWQDRRTADACDALKASGHEASIQHQTGLVLDPYFSATKMRWILDNVPGAAALGNRLAFGTIDAWLMWQLTGGAHVTDASNASRTMLLGLTGTSWDANLADLIGVPLATLPQVIDTHGRLGTTAPDLFGAPIPICGMAGDQQAATIGQGCLSAGRTKATFGTGAFILSSTGAIVPASQHRLLGTIVTQTEGARSYALEGSVFVAGSAIKWLRDGLGLIDSASESAHLAASVPDAGGVVFVPALTGLGAPHWIADATGTISGLTLGTTKAHVARAALESMACQCSDLAAAFAADGAAWDGLRIDGGMSANDWMAQDLADILAIPVDRPANVETTALGAAMLAAVGCGLYPDLDAAKAMRGPIQRFTPSMPAEVRERRLVDWDRALTATLSATIADRPAAPSSLPAGT